VSPDPPDASPVDDEARRDDGLDLARTLARATARSTPGRKKAVRRADRTPRTGRVSGAHPDDRDPQTLDLTLGRLVDDQGWETELRVHGVFTRWAAVVGAEVAAHVVPESYVDGRLVVRTDSTAWATEMKLLAGNLVHRLNHDLGDGTVEVIDVLGPHTPRWTSGRLRVKGRGPRDTYG